MNILYHIRNWVANLLGYRQGIVFHNEVPVGVREGFRIRTSGVVSAKLKKPIKQGDCLTADDIEYWQVMEYDNWNAVRAKPPGAGGEKGG